jgi:isochorismate synthase
VLVNAGNKISVIDALGLCLKKNLRFAAYRLPNTENPEIVVQTSNQTKLIIENEISWDFKGFLVAPFSDEGNFPAFLIAPDIYVTDYLSADQYQIIQNLDTEPVQSDATHIPEEVTHDEYINQLDIILNNISEGRFEKVVLSRVKIVEGQYVSSLAEIFSLLCKSYSNAFVYIFNSGPHLWLGATPEPLLKAKNGTMQTVSLAGTRPYSEQNMNIGAWNSKERLEQEYVTRYIAKVLSHFNLKDVDLQGPYTKKAGNLLHLRTDFLFRTEDIFDKLGSFLRELHPTPAVCGMPRHDSLELLQKLEKHQREYYAGFLGPIGLNDRLSLFVNLRCMKVLTDTIALFVGGGITADSDPEDEWLETEMKAETLLSVIRKITKY